MCSVQKQESSSFVAMWWVNPMAFGHVISGTSASVPADERFENKSHSTENSSGRKLFFTFMKRHLPFALATLRLLLGPIALACALAGGHRV